MKNDVIEESLVKPQILMYKTAVYALSYIGIAYQQQKISGKGDFTQQFIVAM